MPNLGNFLNNCIYIFQIYKILPLFDWIFIEPYKYQGIKFNSEVNIDEIVSPILQLHSKDDPTVPFYLGHKVSS